MGGCDPVVFEVVGGVFRVGGGSPEFAGTLAGGCAFVRCATGIGGAHQAVLWCLGGALCEVCRNRAGGHAGGDRDEVPDVGGGG